ncbi:MAG: homocysteine S-methyltransferase family protein [Pseudomonadota bacterium]|jgi:homocysteine S-methyltransferase|nr:homocysteine S-methyltransferase family protein [Gammaproteobacteria bacterium]
MNNRYQKLMSRMDAGELILIDGATGTEIERRGVPQLNNAWNGGGALSHPSIVREVHQDYIEAGSQIIISNTFATCEHTLRDAGMAEHFETLNRRGVELAVEARDQSQAPDVLVAGGISYWSFTGNKPSLSALSASVTDQAGIMKNAGADLLMLEMMIDIDRMCVTLEGALASDLPVWVGVTCKIDSQGVVCLRNGEPLSSALESLKTYTIPLISIMHTQVDIITECLSELNDSWAGSTGVYAHSRGDRVTNHNKHAWDFDGVISPEDYLQASNEWCAQGINALGCCCGLGVEHIKTLRENLTT